MKFACVFPGQGSQSIGMMAEFIDRCDVVKNLFTRASDALGYDLAGVIANGPVEELNKTACTQPAMLVAGVAAQLNPDALDWCRKEIKVIPDFGELKESMMLTQELGWRGKTIDLNYPEGCKDINDIYSHGLNVMGLLI